MSERFSDFDLTMVKGATRHLRATVKINGVAQDISSWSQFWFYAKDDQRDSDADAIITKTLTGGGIVFLDEQNGLLQVTLTSTDTEDLSNYRNWLFGELKGLDGDGNPWPVAQGTLKVSPLIVEALV